MITVQVESFAASVAEIDRLTTLHWNELALFRDRMPLAPQYAEYIQREARGQLFLTTARVDGQIKAYYIAQVAPGFHYGKTMTAHMDVMYVTPDMKGRGLAFPLARRVEKELRRRLGPNGGPWYSGYKTDNPNGMPEFYRLMGFKPADTYLVKWVGGETG
jgi:GNAT superfamily N-acetyltransferase